MKRALNWLTSNRILAALWLIPLAWLWGILARLPGFQWAWIVVALCVVTTVGLFMRWNWARILAATLFLLYGANAAVRLFTSGWKTSRALMAVGAGCLAWGLWRKPEEGFFDIGEPEKDEDEPDTLISLVLLRTSQRYLEPLVLAQALSDAWNLRLSVHSSDDPEDNAHDDNDGFVAETGPVYVVFVTKPTAFFLVHNQEGNYFDNPDTLAADVPNLRFAGIIRDHQAWLSVDLLSKSSAPETLSQAYRFIGKAISTLADDATLALLCPQHNFFNLWSEKLEEQLCGPEPLKAFEQEVQAPIIGVKDGSGMSEAIAEARRRWPEFVEAFRRRNPDGAPFIVKAPFTTGDDTEHMWLEVFALEPEYVHGNLLNDPFYHPKLKKGSQVEVPVNEVSDWVFAENDKAVGNFTGRVVNQAQKSGSKGKDKTDGQ